MPTKDNIVRGVRMAATYIELLGKVDGRSKVPYFLSCMDDEGVELAIAPRTETEYWKIAKILNVAPIHSGLIATKTLHMASLIITSELITPDQELEPDPEAA